MLDTIEDLKTESSIKVSRVRMHFRENKNLYTVGGVCLAVGAIGALFINKESGPVIGKITQVGFWNQVRPTTINLVERSTPSRPVHLVGTNLYFNSLNEAARETGHNLSRLSQHVNGKFADVNGDVFELLEPAS
jgi:hypothetical protein